MEQALYVSLKILIRTFKVTFSYETQRGNSKIKVVKVKNNSSEEVEYRLNEWVESYNQAKGFRAYSNVKILECEEIDRELIEL